MQKPVLCGVVISRIDGYFLPFVDAGIVSYSFRQASKNGNRGEQIHDSYWKAALWSVGRIIRSQRIATRDILVDLKDTGKNRSLNEYSYGKREGIEDPHAGG